MKHVATVSCLVLILGFVVTAEGVDIPFGTVPLIDGRFTETEWQDATRIQFAATPGGVEITAYLKQATGELYIAFEFTENPNGDLLIPEILIDADNGKTTDWEFDDWVFHVSAQNCETQGSYDENMPCGITRPDWRGRPNYAASPHSGPLPAIEVRIPISKLGITPGTPFGLGLVVHAWPSDTWGLWPEAASTGNPSTWGEATLAVNTCSIACDSD